MDVGTLNCWRPVWPPGPRATVPPVMRIGALTVAEKPPRDVTRFLIATPLGSLESWASAGRPATPTTRVMVRTTNIFLSMAWLLRGYDASVEGAGGHSASAPYLTERLPDIDGGAGPACEHAR